MKKQKYFQGKDIDILRRLNDMLDCDMATHGSPQSQIIVGRNRILAVKRLSVLGLVEITSILESGGKTYHIFAKLTEKGIAQFELPINEIYKIQGE